MADAPHWTVDRRVPVAFLFGLALQFAGAVWWASQIDGRMSAIEQISAAQTVQLNQVAAENQRIQIGAATVGAQLQGVQASIVELKDAQRETNTLLRQYLQERQP